MSYLKSHSLSSQFYIKLILTPPPDSKNNIFGIGCDITREKKLVPISIEIFHILYSIQIQKQLRQRPWSLSQSQSPQVDLQVDGTPLKPQRKATWLSFAPTHLHFLTELLCFKINFFTESEH
jgi:hypothetical protein